MPRTASAAAFVLALLLAPTPILAFGTPAPTLHSALAALAEARTMADPLHAARDLLGLPRATLASPEPLPLGPAIAHLYRALGLPLGPGEHALVADAVATLPPWLQTEVGALVTLAAHCHEETARAWSNASPDEKAFLQEVGKRVALSEPERAALGAISARVDRARVVACGILLADAVEGAAARMASHERAGPGPTLAPLDGLPGTDPYMWKCDGTLSPGPYHTPWQDPVHRLVRIGDERDNCYTAGGTVLTIDLGGSDVYRNGAGAAEFHIGLAPFRVSVSLDLAPEGWTSNDRYLGPHARGMSGIGLLLDEGGDDAYTQAASQVAASVGLALLDDRGGDNAYTCGSSCQASAVAGAIAILNDHRGADRYTMTGSGAGDGYFGQGYAILSGLAALLDHRGGDVFVAQGKAQGLGELAGIGILLDVQGHDVYAVADEDSRASGATKTGSSLFVDLSGSDGYLGIPASGNNRHWPARLMPSPSNLPAADHVYTHGKDCDTVDLATCLVLNHPVRVAR